MIIEINSTFVELPYTTEELIVAEEEFEYNGYVISPLNWFGLSENERSELLQAYGTEYPEPDDVYEFMIVKNENSNYCSVYLYEYNLMEQQEFWKEAIDNNLKMTMGEGGKIYNNSLKVVNI